MRVSVYEMAVELWSSNMFMEYRGVVISLWQLMTSQVHNGLEFSFSCNYLLQMKYITQKQVLRSCCFTKKEAWLAPAQSSLLLVWHCLYIRTLLPSEITFQSMPHQKKAWLDWCQLSRLLVCASQAFFWNNSNKNLKTCFSMMRLKGIAYTQRKHKCNGSVHLKDTYNKLRCTLMIHLLMYSLC